MREIATCAPESPLATLFLIGTTSCAAPDTPDVGYRPPSGQPPADRAAFVRQQAWLVWGNILDHLQQRVAAFNEASGKLVVVYKSEPEHYVDCGWIVTHDDDEFDRFPAARSDARLLRRRDGKVVTVERDLKLDAHMDVHVVASGENAIVRAESTYV